MIGSDDHMLIQRACCRGKYTQKRIQTSQDPSRMPRQVTYGCELSGCGSVPDINFGGELQCTIASRAAISATTLLSWWMWYQEMPDGFCHSVFLRVRES